MSPRVPETPVYSTCQFTLALVQDLLSVEVGGTLADSGEKIKTLLSSPFIVFAKESRSPFRSAKLVGKLSNFAVRCPGKVDSLYDGAKFRHH